MRWGTVFRTISESRGELLVMMTQAEEGEEEGKTSSLHFRPSELSRLRNISYLGSHITTISWPSDSPMLLTIQFVEAMKSDLARY